MVKTVELSAAVPGYTAEALFELVYSVDGAFLRHFHLTVNNDPEASVGEWSGDERCVSFTTPLDAPALIKRLVGKDAMRVVETQRRATAPDGSLTLTSTPVPDMPGGAKFSTQAVLTFRDQAGTIEAFMAEAGRKSLLEFLEAVQAHAAAPQGTAVAQAPPAAPPLPEPLPAAAAGAVAAAPAGEHFYDAPELPLPPVPSGDGLRYEDAALLYLRYMCRTGDQTVGLLQALDAQVRSLQSKVALLQQAAEERQHNRRWLPEWPATVSTRQAVLGAALVASASATAALLWGRRQNAPGHFSSI